MDKEMERYRAKLQRKWDRRTTRRDNGGRRKADYHAPKFWTVGFIVQFFSLIIGGLILLVLAGCAMIKKSIVGG